MADFTGVGYVYSPSIFSDEVPPPYTFDFSTGPGTVQDGENDDSFEVGDSEFAFNAVGTLGENVTYLGTVTIDGRLMPVFEATDGSRILVDPGPGELNPPPTFLPVPTAEDFAFCFLAGTMIATPSGERAVETLAIGDPVLTADGRTVPVRWVGRQTVLPALAPERMLPVRIARGALSGVVAGGADAPVPHRGLIVTADHGMMIEGADGESLVANASALVNGTTIRFVAASELESSVVYYHVETEGHDAILSEGAPAETFIDYRARRSFDNHAEYLTLYGAERIVPEMVAPRISTPRLLPASVRAALGIEEDRSAERALDEAIANAA